MNDILTQIIANKADELNQQMQQHPIEELCKHLKPYIQSAPIRSMKRSLIASSTGIIAEFKRRSPSKGWIFQDADPTKIVPDYEAAGAAALSILTDQTFFGGTINDIHRVRPLTQLPILRKDFIIHNYQLVEARLAGADAVLLIAACLSKQQCDTLAAQAHELGLEVLLEVHSENELSYIGANIDLVGVNNRNLGSFVTDVNHSFELIDKINNRIEAIKASGILPATPLLISESGLNNPVIVDQLRKAGFRGFLMGEAFMRNESPAESLHTFLLHLNSLL